MKLFQAVFFVDINTYCFHKHRYFDRTTPLCPGCSQGYCLFAWHQVLAQMQPSPSSLGWLDGSFTPSTIVPLTYFHCKVSYYIPVACPQVCLSIGKGRNHGFLSLYSRSQHCAERIVGAGATSFSWMDEWLDRYFMCKNQLRKSGYRTSKPWKTYICIWSFMIDKELLLLLPQCFPQ